MAREGIAFLAAVALCAGVKAMTLARHGDTLILTGTIERRDLDRVQAEFAKPPAITTVVLRNSMGGNSWTGYRLGELFRERGVRTLVSGHCVSACSRLFLGGVTRQFTDDYPASLTWVGFHGHYEFDRLDPKASEKYDQAGWTRRFTGDRVNEALLARWLAIPERAGDLRFYPAAAGEVLGARTFLCQGHEPRRPQSCERLTRADEQALANGIVTTEVLASSVDAAPLPFKQRERAHPTSGHAALRAIERLPATSAGARRDYRAFLDANLPRAFAVSADGQRWGWAGHDERANERALERCGDRARCRLYAVDERVVWAASR